MQAATINESRWEARAKYAEYMKAVRERHTAEYETLKNAYRELSRGNQVIDLVQTMRTAGVDAQWRPRLAIAPAHAKVCWFQHSFARGGRPLFSPHQWHRSRKSRHETVLPVGTILRPATGRVLCRAIVPSIPPSLLPAGRLDRYWILWEAEWESVPVDPMLLRKLGDGIYVVLATWDLTPLEQAVLRSSSAL